MSIFEHHRFEIWNQTQHPYKHDASEFGYTTGALPGVTSFGSAMDWVINVLYPVPKASVATPAALPAGGNTIADYRVVLDDGDGKSAGYRWEQREGDAVAKWYKIYDMDFGAGSVLQQAMSNAQELFVQKFGNNDLDSSGAAVAGTYAGQVIYGGTTANTNLTLRANAGDGVGSNTGFVQVDDHFRPATTAVLDIGTTSNLFRNFYLSKQAFIGGVTSDTADILAIGNFAAGANAVLSGTTQNGASIDFTATSATTVAARGVTSLVRTVAASFTTAVVSNFLANSITKGASNTITRSIQYELTGALTVGTNNAGIADNESFTGDYFINASSTKPSVFGGHVGLGGAKNDSAILTLAATQTAVLTGTDQIGLLSSVVSNSSSTGSTTGIQSGSTTTATSYTTAYRAQFQSNNVTKGAGSTITRDISYFGAIATQGTNNAFMSDNTSFSGSWGINLATTNANSLGGDLRVGTAAVASATNERLTVSQSIASAAAISAFGGSFFTTISGNVANTSGTVLGLATEFRRSITADTTDSSSGHTAAFQANARLSPASTFTYTNTGTRGVSSIVAMFPNNVGAGAMAVTNAAAINIDDGGGSGITRKIGIRFFSAIAGGTNNCFIGDNVSFTGDYFINSASTNESLLSGNLRLATAGKGLLVKEGTNAKMGASVLVGGTVTVSTTAVTSSSRIFLSNILNGGTAGFLRVSTITNGTSFIITSSNGTDTSTIAWLIVEPA